MLCRYGGDEFTVLMPDTDIDGADAACKRIKEAVSKLRFSAAPGFITFGHEPDEEVELRRPIEAATIAPADIMGARHRSFWLDGMCGPATMMSWQRFIARLVAHGPVNKFVPGSILQDARTDYTLWGPVASDVEIDMS